jgi:hypothetical protein
MAGSMKRETVGDRKFIEEVQAKLANLESDQRLVVVFQEGYPQFQTFTVISKVSDGEVAQQLALRACGKCPDGEVAGYQRVIIFHDATEVPPTWQEWLDAVGGASR